jgi:hypothetical protein
MSEKWYYVHKGERQGPIEFDSLLELYQQSTLNSEDYVWTKGFENWMKIKDLKQFQVAIAETNNINEAPNIPSNSSIAMPSSQKLSLTELAPDHNCIFIRIGVDRGTAPVEYGPFSINILKKLFDENRVNGKTQVFTQGMGEWSFLAETDGFEEVFEQLPPQIEDSERRNYHRKPFIARMFIENNQKVFEGICRDISVGGMQVLVDHFPGKVEDQITINVHPENSDYHFAASGKIVRLLEGNLGFSFRFINLSDDAITAIDRYLNQ